MIPSDNVSRTNTFHNVPLLPEMKEEVAGVNYPLTTLVTSNEVPPFWK